jgi:tRNA (cmo5U34)-methyltransferase
LNKFGNVSITTSNGFSHLETGNTAQVDSVLSLELISEAAAAINPHAHALLDVGCGAGNYSLKILERLPALDVTLVDLSRPMLDRAHERISAATRGAVRAIQADVREVELGEETFDVIVAAAVLHHLRTDSEWQAVFAKLYQALKLGGSLWIYDLVQHVHPPARHVGTLRPISDGHEGRILSGPCF